MTVILSMIILFFMLLPLTSKAFVQQEFGSLDLGDSRLNSRALKVAEMINDSPTVSFPNAANGIKSELKGFYRFFQNEKITDQKILQSHYYNTINRMNECPNPILLITDSMFMNPAKSSSMDGLKDMGKGKENGIRIHYMIAVDSVSGDVLGITDLRILGDSLGKVNITLTKESDLWKLVAITTVKRINDILTKKEAKRLINRCSYVGDREADDYDLLLLIHDLNLNFIIRSQYDRKLDDKIFEGKYKISEFEKEEVKHGRPYEIKVTEKGKERTAIVQRSVLKFYELQPPGRKSKKTKSIVVSIVFVKEIKPPKNVTPVSWRILTSHSTKNESESKSIVSAYIKRWVIEELNKCSKTGVSLEERQFTKPEHLWPAIAMIMVVSWRILHIRDLGRRDEDAVAKDVFNSDEMNYLDVVIEEKKSKEDITVKDVIDHIACLGGFLGGYDYPGWIILWRGWFKFVLRVQGFTIAKKGL